MKDLENNIQAKESELINFNYNRNIQTERDALVNDLHNFLYENNMKYRHTSSNWVLIRFIHIGTKQFNKTTSFDSHFKMSVNALNCNCKKNK